jgi:aminobenzoyl-glutamate transport protein
MMISLAFFVAGIAYGYGVGTIKTPTEVINAVTKSWAGLAGLLLLFVLIAQFIAYFNYSKMPEVAATWLGDTIEGSNVGGIWLLLAAIAITGVLNIILPQAIAKWALLAPIFIPLFLRLGIDPATVLAAYRVADAPGNVINPIMPYFPLVVVFARRYDKRSGIGTVIALMMPFFVALAVVWTLFFIAWYLLGIPVGIGT